MRVCFRYSELCHKLCFPLHSNNSSDCSGRTHSNNNLKTRRNIKNIHAMLCPVQVKTEEMERVIHELENALQRSAFELDRRLTQQQQEYEKKIQLLMHQLMMAEGNTSSSLVNGDSGSGAKSVPWEAVCLLSSVLTFCSHHIVTVCLTSPSVLTV